MSDHGGIRPGPPAEGVDARYVSFVRALELGFRGFRLFGGRSSRSECWWWFLFVYPVATIPTFLTTTHFLQVMAPRGYEGIRCLRQSGAVPKCDVHWAITPLLVYSLLASLVLMLPTLAVTYRRLHDTGRTGWWVTVLFIPGLTNRLDSIPVLVVAWIICHATMWVLAALPGEPEYNRFGYVPHQGVPHQIREMERKT